MSDDDTRVTIHPEVGDVTVTVPRGHGVTITYTFALGADGPNLTDENGDVLDVMITRLRSCVDYVERQRHPLMTIQPERLQGTP